MFRFGIIGGVVPKRVSGRAVKKINARNMHRRAAHNAEARNRARAELPPVEEQPVGAEDEVPDDPTEYDSESSVDMSAFAVGPDTQIPREKFGVVLTPHQCFEDRLKKHIIKKTDFRCEPFDDLLVRAIQDIKSTNRSMEDLSTEIATELNLHFAITPMKNVSKRSDCLVRKSILSKMRYWKVPLNLLEELVTKYPGASFQRAVNERVAKIQGELEVNVSYLIIFFTDYLFLLFISFI